MFDCITVLSHVIWLLRRIRCWVLKCVSSITICSGAGSQFPWCGSIRVVTYHIPNAGFYHSDLVHACTWGNLLMISCLKHVDHHTTLEFSLLQLINLSSSSCLYHFYVHFPQSICWFGDELLVCINLYVRTKGTALHYK